MMLKRTNVNGAAPAEHSFEAPRKIVAFRRAAHAPPPFARIAPRPRAR
jgi:hypothetical protein